MATLEDYEREDLEKEKKIKKNDKDDTPASFVETEDFLVEQVATHATHATHTWDSQYLIYNKHTGSTRFHDKFVKSGITYVPIKDEITMRGMVNLPTGIEKYGSISELLSDIETFLYKYFEVPTKHEKLLPCLILFYWVYDRFPFVPYIHFMGRTGTGKSTAAEVLSSISYKSINASGAITIASIFRIASMWQGTLFIDEFSASGDNYKEMLSLLKSGVSDSAVLRVEGEKKREVKAYIVKSPKIFTSEKPINDAGLQSRVIEVKMTENKRQIPLYRDQSYQEEAQTLRNKLLLFRLNKYNKIDLSEIRFGYEELRVFSGRVQQVVTPIYYMADEAAKKKILKFAKQQQEETLRERRESLDGQIFEYIFDNRNIEVTISMIYEHLTKGNANKFLTEKKIANVIRKILNFKIERRGHNNISTIIIKNKENKIKELSDYYGLGDQESIVRVARVARVANDIDELFGDISK